MMYAKAHYTYEDHRSIKTLGFHVEHGYIDADFPMHRHDFYEAFVIVSGSATHLLGEQRSALKRGDAFAVKGSAAHGFADVHGLEILNLMYDPGVFRQHMTQLCAIPGFTPLFLVEPSLRPLGRCASMTRLDEASLLYAVSATDYLQACIAQSEEDDRAAIQFYFQALTACIAAKYEAEQGDVARMNVLSGAIQTMEQSISEELTLHEIADSAHLSARQLERVFLAVFGKSPMRYLLDMRLDNAMTLLTQYGLSVADAAVRSGFRDPAYFARMFRAAYGITPRQAREKR